MGNDLLRGRRLELPWFAGKVIDLGRKHNVPTLVNRFVYAALKRYVNGPPPTLLVPSADEGREVRLSRAAI